MGSDHDERQNLTNQLAHETSPYLKQHQDNPVDWHPWGDAALLTAKQEHKPIFLSIGYAACHWCHVMAHESFENEHTAQIMNENFINIKVDREERPDLDDIYMQAVVMLTGQGGWPLSVFLTPDLKPFYGGTYFPPEPRHRLPSFNQVLLSVSDTWQNNPDAIYGNANILTREILNNQIHQDGINQNPNMDEIVNNLHHAYDWQTGGWGNAPKFPQPMIVEFLLHRAKLGDSKAQQMVNHLLDKMALGGMYDLVGGGFHRYSTDRHWLIPHFEKMLYDNAQLALVYLHAYALTGHQFFLAVVNKTLSFIQEELTDVSGGFFASMDADTPEGEGSYYAWSINDLKQALSTASYSILQTATNVSTQGNFADNLNVLQLRSELAIDTNQATLQTTELDHILSQLKQYRDRRTPPEKDKKIITEWNALAIRAFSEAGLVLNRKDYLLTAKKAADFLLENLLTPDRNLYRIWCEGKPSQPGTLADYSGFIIALLSLYVIDFDPIFINYSQTIFELMKNNFSSQDDLYYDTAGHVTNLIVRPRNLQDNAIPSGNALAAHVHWMLSNYAHDTSFHDLTERMIRQAGKQINHYPTSFGYWLQVASLIGSDSKQIALVTDQSLSSLQPFLDGYRQGYRPDSVIAAFHGDLPTNTPVPHILDGRKTIDGQPTAYVCQGFVCQAPTTDIKQFLAQLE